MTIGLVLLFPFLSLLLLPTSYSMSSSRTFHNYTDKSALCEIYDLANGMHWNWTAASIAQRNLWNCSTSSTSDPCIDEWWGVNCTCVQSKCSVTSVILVGVNMSGRLPTVIDIRNLNIINFRENSLHGSLPVLNSTSVVTADFNDNHISGSIPAQYSMLRSLEYFNLFDNAISGILPTFLGELSNLTSMSFSSNRFYGTVPTEFAKLHKLTRLGLHNNQLFGLFPPSLFEKTSLTVIRIFNNSLSGTIPPGFTNLVNLQLFEIAFNKFSGSLPMGIGNLNKIETFVVNSNTLTGTIPSDITEMSDLRNLYVNGNKFVGRFPRNLTKLGSLRALFLSGNKFHGRVSDIFTSVMPNLEMIDISNNKLDGTIPGSVFTRELQYFTASENCIDSTLPDTLCTATNLKKLVISGLNSACTSNGWFRTDGSTRSVGYLPSCTWNLPSLETMQIFSNGFRGGIPEILPSSNLFEVNAKGNHLASTIPESLLRVPSLKILDLSNNKIFGTIPDIKNFSVNSVTLKTNSLSGSVPRNTFLNLNMQVDVLLGNMFHCNLDKKDLPKQDLERHSYVCGSTPLDAALILFWFTFACLIIAASTRHVKLGKEIIETLSSWQSIQQFPNLRSFILTLHEDLILVSKLSLAILIFQMIVFSSLKTSTDYSTQSYQYSYYVSAAYMSGLAPLASMTCLILLSLSIYVYYTTKGHFHKYLRLVDDSIEGRDDSISRQSMYLYFQRFNFKKKILVAGLLFVDFFGVIGLNVLYILLNRESEGIVEVSFLILSITLINMLITNFFVPKYSHYISKALDLPHLSGSVFLRSGMVIFNTIVAPFLSVVFTSSECFVELITGVDAVTFESYIPFCQEISSSSNIICLNLIYIKQTLSFTPPLIYNNRCRDQIFPYYIPVQLLTCAIEIVAPVMLMHIMSQYDNPRSSIYDFILRRCGSIYWPKEEFSQPFVFIHDTESVMTNKIVQVCIIFTLGILAPPVLVAENFVMLCAYIVQRVLILRYVNRCDDKARILNLEKSCRNAWSCPCEFSPYLCMCACFSHMFFLLDMSTDKYTIKESLWILVIFILFPILLLFLLWRQKNFMQNFRLSNSSKNALEFKNTNIANNCSEDLRTKENDTKDDDDHNIENSIINPIITNLT